MPSVLVLSILITGGIHYLVNKLDVCVCGLFIGKLRPIKIDILLILLRVA